MYEQIARNKRRTFVILFGFVGLVALVGVAFDILFGGGVVGLAIIVLLAAGLALFSYYNSDKVALAASRAKPADETEYRRYHNLVEGLVIAAGLPEAAPLRGRRSRAERVRNRSEPEALRPSPSPPACSTR